jgi:hypothetical protein
MLQNDSDEKRLEALFLEVHGLDPGFATSHKLEGA